MAQFPDCLFFCNQTPITTKGVLSLFFSAFLGLTVSGFVPDAVPVIVLVLFVLGTLCAVFIDHSSESSAKSQMLVLANYALILLFYIGTVVGSLMYPTMAVWPVWVMLVVTVILLVLVLVPQVSFFTPRVAAQ